MTPSHVFLTSYIFSVNIKASPVNTADRNKTDVFADFDAITHGLLGNTELKGGTSLNVGATPNNTPSQFDNKYFHQSQHTSKQR